MTRFVFDALVADLRIEADRALADGDIEEYDRLNNSRWEIEDAFMAEHGITSTIELYGI